MLFGFFLLQEAGRGGGRAFRYRASSLAARARSARVSRPLLLTSSLALTALGRHPFGRQDDFSQGGTRRGCCRDAGRLGQDALLGSRGSGSAVTVRVRSGAS